MFNRYSFLFVLFLLLAGCTAEQPQPGAATSTSPAVGQAPMATPTSSSTPFPAPTTAVPASVTPSPTATPTLHPMSIAALRAGNYPGSEIVIEQELDPGVNYHRYYASYQSEGLKIYALLTMPNGDSPEGGWPAIVFNHGYIAPSVYRTTERYVAYVDWLARSGYIVFRIDYRGHDRSEGVASGAYGSPGYAIDVLNALASIRQYPQANPERVGMWGHSMGGYLTLRAMVVSPDIRAGVIWSGVVGGYPDMVNNWRRSGPTPTPQPYARRWRYDWIQEFGSPEQNPDFWASVSANSYVTDLSGPIQLHHSPEDEDVPVEFSESLAQQIQDVGENVEIYLYPGDNHNLSNNFSVAMNRTIAFFDQYLKP